jgi:hypothetical protein
MTDLNLRRLERAAASGDQDALERLNRARVRAGLKPLKRRIVHYVTPDKHDRVNAAGKIKRLRSPLSGHILSQQWVHAVCSVELYPRQSYYGTRRKHCYYTTEPGAVTCKTCLRWFRAKNRREFPLPAHLAVKATPNGGARALCGRTAGELVEERLVSCHACLSIERRRRLDSGRESAMRSNARMRRRIRRQAAQAELLRG